MRKYLFTIVIATALLVSPLAAGQETKGKTKPAAKSAASKSKPRSKALVRIDRDVSRLESLLAGMTGNSKLSTSTWKKVSNEADALANRIFEGVQEVKGDRKAVRAATQLRRHVRQLHQEAHKGDAADARKHAREALRFAYRLDEWAG